MIEIKVPTVGESISEVTLVKWLKNDGEWVERDEILCELESEKATFELNAEKSGILHIVAKEDQTLAIGELACKIDDEAKRPEGAAAPAPKEEKAAPKKEDKKQEAKQAEPAAASGDAKATPVAKNMMADKKLAPTQVKGTGEGGRIILRKSVDDAVSRARGRFRLDGFGSTEEAVQALRGRGTASTPDSDAG